MAAHDNTHSRLVAWLKILLPLIALGMLSSIFLVSRSIDPNATLPYSQVEIDERVREPRLTTPRFSGVTSDGATISLDAADMRPNLTDPTSGTATDLRAQLVTPDGTTTDIAARTAEIDAMAGTYRMTGDVVLTNSTGYRMTAEVMDGTMDATSLVATGSVEAEGPIGQITADRMDLRTDPAATGQYLLVFNGGVRLVYEPSR
jgi:lipopolysaccharide export system protein LptC